MFVDAHCAQLNLCTRDARMPAGSLSLLLKKEPTVNLLTNTIYILHLKNIFQSEHTIPP